MSKGGLQMKKPSSRIAGFVVVLALSMCGASASAQLLEEITVTAQKREQSAQDVGISMSVFSEEQLRALGVTNAKDLANLTAGVLINMEYGFAPVFTIRGINTNDHVTSTPPSAAIYVDGIYKASNINSGVTMFDLDSVQILKGPQGTLWGRNTTGGAIVLNSKKPSQELDAYIEAGYGTDNRAILEGAIGGPIGEKVAGRFSFQKQDSDGVWDTTTQSPFSETGSIDTFGARGQLLIDVSDDLEIHLIASYATNQSENEPMTQLSVEGSPLQTGPGCVATFTNSGIILSGNPENPDCGNNTPATDPFDGIMDTDFRVPKDSDFSTAIARIDWQINDLAKLVSITGYDAFSRFTVHDFDNFSVRDGTQVYIQDYEQLSQELHFEFQTDNMFLLLGAYYEDAEFDVPTNPGGAAPSTLGIPNGNAFVAGGAVAVDLTWQQEIDTKAIFAHSEFNVTDRVDLIAGVRYEDEAKKNRHADYFGPTGSIDYDNPIILNGLQIDEASFSGWSYKLGINFRPNDELLAYFSHALGIKSGGMDNGFNRPSRVFDAEKLRSSELGIKWDASDNIRFNGSVFFYDYKNHQVRSAFNDPLTGIGGAQFLNIEGADVYGADLELVWAPVDGLNIQAAASFLETDVSDSRPTFGFVATPAFPDGDPSQPVSADGKHLALAPENAFTFLARYEWPVSSNLYLAVQGDVGFTGDHFPSIENIPFEEQSYTQYGARVGLGDADGTWEVAVTGRNLDDDYHLINAFGTGTARQYFVNSPGYYMATFRYRFD